MRVQSPVLTTHRHVLVVCMVPINRACCSHSLGEFDHRLGPIVSENNHLAGEKSLVYKSSDYSEDRPMPFAAKKIAQFIVASGNWEEDRYGTLEASKTMSFRLEGVVTGKGELIAELDKLLPSLLVSPVDAKVATNSASHSSGQSDVMLRVDERDLLRVRQRKSLHALTAA
jgi:hypothetical protein